MSSSEDTRRPEGSPLRGGADRLTSGAAAGHLDRVRLEREAVLGSEIGEPGIELAVDELDDAMAAGADEMVVVPVAAEAVARLAAVV